MLSGARGDGLVRDNAVRILAEVETLASRTGKRVVLVGHSKGGLDCAAALALFEERLAEHVRGLVTVQSPYGGSPIAADLLAEPTLAKAVEVILEKLVGAPAGEEHFPSSPVFAPWTLPHSPQPFSLRPHAEQRTSRLREVCQPTVSNVVALRPTTAHAAATLTLNLSSNSTETAPLSPYISCVHA